MKEKATSGGCLFSRVDGTLVVGRVFIVIGVRIVIVRNGDPCFFLFPQLRLLLLLNFEGGKEFGLDLRKDATCGVRRGMAGD